MASRLQSFVLRIEALDDAAWARISQRVPHLVGDDISALLSRARTAAVGMPDAIPSSLRMVAAVAHELFAEFPSSHGGVPTTKQVENSRLSPSAKANAMASATLARVLDARRVSDPGAVACIQAVMPAIIGVAVPLEKLSVLYEPLEDEIPFASLVAE